MFDKGLEDVEDLERLEEQERLETQQGPPTSTMPSLLDLGFADQAEVEAFLREVPSFVDKTPATATVFSECG